MAVEEARHVLSGDWIAIDYGGTEVECEVVCTVHGASDSVIGVMLADDYQRLEMLPDDPVMVVHYSGGD
jgi:hypothetical protein